MCCYTILETNSIIFSYLIKDKITHLYYHFWRDADPYLCIFLPVEVLVLLSLLFSFNAYPTRMATAMIRIACCIGINANVSQSSLGWKNRYAPSHKMWISEVAAVMDYNGLWAHYYLIKTFLNLWHQCFFAWSSWSCMNNILLKKQKNIVDTADREKYDFATLRKRKWKHKIHSSNYFINNGSLSILWFNQFLKYM